jgi:hypothetical protein
MRYGRNVNQMGWVYFLFLTNPGETEEEAGTFPGYMKIGFTTNPNDRFYNLKTSTPFHLELEAMFPGTEQDERDLHKRLAKHRARREWFRLTDELDDFVGDLQDAQTMLTMLHDGEEGYEPTLNECLAFENPREALDAFFRGANMLGLTPAGLEHLYPSPSPVMGKGELGLPGREGVG